MKIQYDGPSTSVTITRHNFMLEINDGELLDYVEIGLEEYEHRPDGGDPWTEWRFEDDGDIVDDGHVQAEFLEQIKLTQEGLLEALQAALKPVNYTTRR